MNSIGYIKHAKIKLYIILSLLPIYLYFILNISIDYRCCTYYIIDQNICKYEITYSYRSGIRFVTASSAKLPLVISHCGNFCCIP